MKKHTFALAAASLAVLLAGCQPVAQQPNPNPTGQPTTQPGMQPGAQPSAQPSGQPAAQFMQVERLARPAINEGLIITNDLLNLWNTVPPTVDTTPAAGPIAAEATAVLKALGNSQERIDALFTVLLPDVMRIDTTKPSGYATLTANLRPIGGRMIKDDVIDITLGLIVPDATASAVPNLETDFVSYEQAHDPLLPQFPYLVTPN